MDFPATTYRDEFRWLWKQAKTPTVRSMADWVEAELVIPDGPFKGERYRHYRHPVSRLWFDAVDSGQWTRVASTGPTQCGKTLMTYVVPVLYHLFEMRETVIVGLPDMNMASDKWEADFLPAIEASRYASLLPTRGEGSRGGTVKRAIRFTNGVTLRFMSGGGSDKKRAGYTSRVLAVTETDGMDAPGETSREADKIEQLEGRTRAYGRTGKRVYLECTVSIEKGRIWQEWLNGTQSRIARPCPHCGEYVCPERDHLIGWRDAESEEEAAEKSTWTCPLCEKPWTETERQQAAERAVLVHRGQSVLPGGNIVGDVPRTQTLGFRWSAIDNPFTTAADLGAEEWLAAHGADRENAEKKMRQFVWAIPYEPPDVDLTPLDAGKIRKRSTRLKKGVVPVDCIGVVVGIDTGKRELNWSAHAARQGGGAAIIEYGEQPVASDKLGTYAGLIDALKTLRAYLERGWSDESGKRYTPAQVWIDSGYHEHTDAVYTLCAWANRELKLRPGAERYRPSKGYGEGQRGTIRYAAPKQRTTDVRYIGKEYHFTLHRRAGAYLVHVNGDHWKSVFHQGLAMAADDPLAIVLYDAASHHEHEDYAYQVTAEVQKEKWIEGKGPVIVWERKEGQRKNHKLDAGYVATAAAHFVTEMARRRVAPQRKAEPQPARQTEDRAFLASERN